MITSPDGSPLVGPSGRPEVNLEGLPLRSMRAFLHTSEGVVSGPVIMERIAWPSRPAATGTTPIRSRAKAPGPPKVRTSRQHQGRPSVWPGCPVLEIDPGRRWQEKRSASMGSSYENLHVHLSDHEGRNTQECSHAALQAA
jgi:hypothetical protein